MLNKNFNQRWFDSSSNKNVIIQMDGLGNWKV